MTEHINPQLDPQIPAAIPALLPQFLRLQRGARATVPTGIKGWDSHTGGLFPGLHILGSKPNVGKTTLALQICLQAAKSGLPSLFLSFDESPTQLSGKAVAMASGIAQSRLRTDEGLAELEEAAARLHDQLAPVRFLGGHAEVSGMTAADGLLNLMKLSGKQSGLIVVDFLQTWAARRYVGDFRKATSECVAELQDAVRTANVPVLAICALSREGYEKGKPSMSALRESSDLEYLADTVTLMAEDETRSVGGMRRALTLHLVKNRRGPVGCQVHLLFDGEVGKFHEDGGYAF
jgi:replicative DNA helicase